MGAPLQTDEILALVRRHNERETKTRREYYDYLLTKAPQEETFEQHLDRYGFLARTCEPATPEEVRELEALAGVTLPLELRELYTSLGQLMLRSLDVGGIELFSVPELLRRLRLPSGGQRCRSLGLVHMMSASWWNDRAALEPDSGWLGEDEIARLNAAYTCFGWMPSGDGEGFRYPYFDRAGNFGTLDYHQDAFGELHAELVRMQARSPADSTLSDIVLAALREPLFLLDADLG